MMTDKKTHIVHEQPFSRDNMDIRIYLAIL